MNVYEKLYMDLLEKIYGVYGVIRFGAEMAGDVALDRETLDTLEDILLFAKKQTMNLTKENMEE